MAIFTHLDQLEVESYIEEIHNALENYDLEEFFTQLTNLFANIPYHLPIDQEKYYHSFFQFMGTLLGMHIQSEVATDKGRIDVTLITAKYIYIFEFKFNQPSKKALEQIEQKKYYEKYLNKKKKIILVGISFNRKKSELSLAHTAKEV